MEESHTQALSEADVNGVNRSSLVRFIVDVIETLLLSVILFLGINAVTARIRVDGSSMEPTLHNGEFIVVNKLAYRFGNPQTGDVIVFHFPRDPEQEYIKRVIGLPGDQVEIVDRLVFLNGSPIQEPYIAAPPNYGPASWSVPEGSLFVLGDNRNNSSDSRTWGTVPLEYVVGKAFLVYWPPTDWGIIEHISPALP